MSYQKKRLMELRTYVPYDLALQLKELGFNEYCHTWYDHRGEIHWFRLGYTQMTCAGCNKNLPEHTCVAPEIPELVSWIRQSYGLFLTPKFDLETRKYSYEIIDVKGEPGWQDTNSRGKTWKTPSDALLEGIKWLAKEGKL
jgi:hypothetical protein